MKNSQKTVCRMTAALIKDYGVRDVIVCPGSRNTPLIMAVNRDPAFMPRTVVDERSAAFAALGLSVQTRRPVALICTSGSAVLNMAPAVAEAYYRRVPLIVISADRPAAWIDQNDNQTIRQNGALGNIVLKTIDITDSEQQQDLWHAQRLLNDALTAATAKACGPVHINIHLDVPLTAEADIPSAETFSRVDTVYPDGVLSTARARELGLLLAPPRKVMFLIGGLQPSSKISKALAKLAKIPNIVVMAEAQSNVHAEGILHGIDEIILAMTDDQRREFMPDILVTVGGGFVSHAVKPWLRGQSSVSHWSVGLSDHIEDTFMRAVMHIDMDPDDFLPQIASAVQPFRNDPKTYARRLPGFAYTVHKAKEAIPLPWCDLVAVKEIVDVLPSHFNVHVSNGTSARYIQLANPSRLHGVFCNRGVSGIEGSTSTAIGASWEFNGPTLLITGDMSAEYDINALSLPDIRSDFRVVVLSNGGGNIFRYIKNTRDLPETEDFLAVGNRVPLRGVVESYGWHYIEVTDRDSLLAALPWLWRKTDSPVLINVVTDGHTSASALNEYLNNN